MKPLFTGEYCPNNCDKPTRSSTERSEQYEGCWWSVDLENKPPYAVWATQDRNTAELIRQDFWPESKLFVVVPKTVGSFVEYRSFAGQKLSYYEGYFLPA